MQRPFCCPERRLPMRQICLSFLHLYGDFFPYIVSAVDFIQTFIGPFYSSYFPPTNGTLLLSSLVFKNSYTVNVTAWPGATRIIRGVIPLQNAWNPSCLPGNTCQQSAHIKYEIETYLNISLAIFVILLNAVSPGCPGVFCNLVLMVSIGALLKGPIAPETRPIMVV